MLYVSGVRTIIRKLGKNSLKSWKFIFLKLWLIRHPRIISIGAKTSSGIMLIKGIKNNDIKNNKLHIIAVNPVLPPSAIPAVPSATETGGLEPNSAHPIVDIETAFKALEVF